VELSPSHKDALTELINIGYGRAAGALSELTGYRITLEVPQVAVHEIEMIGPKLEEILGPSVASVNQAFSGPVAGQALLLLDEPSALVLSDLLGDNRSSVGNLDSNAREIITEVGNILLNACLGVFGNLLRIQVTFAVPRFQVESVSRILELISLQQQAGEKLRYGLLIHTRFYLKMGNVSGYMVIVLGIASLDRLMVELDGWESRQLQ
jgi:chemotaxis protein CheC